MITTIKVTKEAAEEFFTDHNLVKHLSPNIPLVVMKDISAMFKAFIANIKYLRTITLHHCFIEDKFNIGLLCKAHHNRAYTLNAAYDTTKDVQEMVMSAVQTIVKEAMLTVPEPHVNGRLSACTDIVINSTINTLFNKPVSTEDIHVSYMGSKVANSGFIASAKSFDTSLDSNNNPFYLIATLMFRD